MSTEKKVYISTDYTGEAIAPHQYFVTDADGKGKWEEKPFYSEIGEVTPICEDVLLSAVDVDSVPAQFSMSEPLAENIDPEYVYEVSWEEKHTRVRPLI